MYSLNVQIICHVVTSYADYDKLPISGNEIFVVLHSPNGDSLL